jgi:hypothetical protein
MARKLIIASFACIAALGAFLASNPLRRPEPNVKRWLEKITPLGSTLSDVQATAERRGWYLRNRQGSDGSTTGTYIRGELGDYQGLPFRTSVTVFWEFDPSNRLANIRIWKTTDGI